MIATICLIGTDRPNPGACGKPARWTAITSPSALKSGLPDDPPIVMPSNWMTSSVAREMMPADIDVRTTDRSEEHTSELQSPCNLVCRLLLEKKKKQTSNTYTHGPHRRCHHT